LRQAHLTSERLESVYFHHVYASDLPRAFITAKIITEPKRLKVNTDIRLRERNFGVGEGLTHEELAQRAPEVWKNIKNGDVNYVIPNGESKMQVLDRAREFFNELTKKHLTDRILVVSHGGVINVFLRDILGIPQDAPRRFILPNAAINILGFYNYYWQVRTFGDISHLDNINDEVNNI
jgi:broad specificity phosphatase PhoE